MKIVLVSKEYPTSKHSFGIGTFTSELAHGLFVAGHEVLVIAGADAEIQSGEYFDRGVCIFRIEPGFVGDENFLARNVKLLANMRYSVAVANTLDYIAENWQPDIIEFCGYRGESWAWRKRYKDAVYVCRFHGLTGWIDKNWKDYVLPARIIQKAMESAELKGASAVISVSRQYISKLALQINTNNLSIIHNGINVEQWLVDSESTDDRIPGPGGNDIFFVGSYTKVKGIDLLFLALTALRESNEWNGFLYIAGRKGQEFVGIVDEIWGGDKLPPWIVDLGYVPRSRLMTYYRAAAVCCFPSRTESFGFTALEALASGGLVVGSKGTGHEEVLVGSGAILADLNLNSIQLAIKHMLILDEPTRGSMRARGMRHAIDEFDTKRCVNATLKVYINIIK